MIDGVLIIDRNADHPVNISILKGGIGARYVKIKVEADRGVRVASEFFFYTSFHPIENQHSHSVQSGNVILDSFFETEIDFNWKLIFFLNKDFE